MTARARKEAKRRVLEIVRLAEDAPDGISFVFTSLDPLKRRVCLEGDQEVSRGVGDALDELDPTKVSDRVLIALLTDTLPIEGGIPGREAFGKWCLAAIQARHGAKKAQKLLSGLV